MGGSHQEFHTVEVRWGPVMAVHPELQTLFCARRVHHDCPAILDHADCALPKEVSDSVTYVTSEDTWAYL